MPAPSPDLIVRIALVRDEASLRELDPPIWRRFKVSSSINLDLLHDKVLVPVVGWTRNYHTYYFRPLPKKKERESNEERARSRRNEGGNGVLDMFGLDEYNGSASYRDCIHYVQTSTSAPDSVHVSKIVDEDKIQAPEDVVVGDLLEGVGDRLAYCYDLGDCWYHCLEVEEVIDASKSDGAVQIVAGAMRCPPEDGDGCVKYQTKILDPLLRIKADPTNHALARKHAVTCFDQIYSLNVREPFRPEDFDLAERQEALSQALASRNHSRQTKLYVTHFCNKGMGIARLGQIHVITKLEDLRVDRHGNKHNIYQETLNVRPDPPETLCYNCGSPHNLKRAISTYYCGRDCQVAHWENGWKNQAKKERSAYRKYCNEKATNTPNPNRFNHDGGFAKLVRWHPGKPRFAVGDFVECLLGDGIYGTGWIVQVGYTGTQDGTMAPYQIKLDRETAKRQGMPFPEALIYATWDDDHQIRLLEKGTSDTLAMLYDQWGRHYYKPYSAEKAQP